MSTDKEVHVVAIIKPKPGKVDRVTELLTNLASSVHKNEPGALRYHLHREVDSKDGSEDLVMIERYADQSAFEKHSSTADFEHLVKTFKEEDLLGGPLVIKHLKPVGGFASRL